MARAFLVILLAGAMLAALPEADSKNFLYVERSSPGDLEVGGELAGVSHGATLAALTAYFRTFFPVGRTR
jgi:hypothetical protein